MLYVYNFVCVRNMVCFSVSAYEKGAAADYILLQQRRFLLTYQNLRLFSLTEGPMVVLMYRERM